jgi:hypothetical protein
LLLDIPLLGTIDPLFQNSIIGNYMNTENKVDSTSLNIGQLHDFLKGAMASTPDQGSPNEVLLKQRTDLTTEIQSLYEIGDSSRMVLWKRLCRLHEYQDAYFFDKTEYRKGSIGKFLMNDLKIPKSTAYSDAKVAKMLVGEKAVSLLDTLKGDRNFKLREIAHAPEGSQGTLLAEIDNFTRDTLKTAIQKARKEATEANKRAKAAKDAEKARKAAEEAKRAEDSEKEKS